MNINTLCDRVIRYSKNEIQLNSNGEIPGWIKDQVEAAALIAKAYIDLEKRLAAANEVIEAVKNIRYSEETDEFNEHDLSQLMVAYAVYSKKFESANG